MVSRQRLFHLITFLLVFTFVLVACERPVPGSDDTDAGTTSNTTDVAGTNTTTETDTVSDSDVATAVPTDVEVDAGDADVAEEVAEPPDPEGPAEESSDDSTPRDAEEEEAEVAEEETSTTEDSDAADVADETDSSDKEDKADEGEAAEAEEPTVESEVEETAESVEIETTAATSHVVAPGENLYRIGLLYNVSWVTLAELNGVDNANQIVAGQILEIPGDPDPEAGPEPTPSPLTETTYTIQVNDNLFTIGLAYGISWVQIAEANGLVNPNQIVVGQVLKIPVDVPGPTPQFTHQVVADETLFLIALRYGVAWPIIAEANDLGSPYVIYTGQTLIIPGGQ